MRSYEISKLKILLVLSPPKEGFLMETQKIIGRLKELLSEAKPDVALTQLAMELGLDTQRTLMLVQKSIESYVKSRLLQTIVKSLEEAKPPLEKINVTDLTFPCLRHAFYSKKFLDERRGRLTDLIAFWIGVKLHEAKIFSHHELEVEYNGVFGRVDGYEDGVILELKTTRSIPPEPYPHHVKQVEYYRVLLEKSGHPVRFGIILYVNVNDLTTKAFLVLFDRSVDEVEKELMDRKERLEKSLKNNTPPPPIPDEPWACDYCRFAYLCGYEATKENTE